MQFEWDEDKSRANIAKHGISFEQAQLIFYGPTVDLVDDRADYVRHVSSRSACWKKLSSCRSPIPTERDAFV